MATHTRVESAEHARLIKMMADHFAKHGYLSIKADLDGYDQPAAVNGYVPDLTCLKNDGAHTQITLEAETCQTIGDQHTDGQWKAFARAPGEFHLVVPKQCGTESGRAKAQRRLAQLGITAETIWAPS